MLQARNSHLNMYQVYTIQMPVDFERTLGKVGNSLRIVIPTKVVDASRLRDGDILLISTTGHEIRMKRKEK